MMLVQPVVMIAQQTEEEKAETELTAREDSITLAKYAKAEKKKEKNTVMIDERFFISLAIDLATVLLIIILIYYPRYHKMDYIFTYIMFNIIIFLLTFVLKYVKLSIGAAFGLFAVFSMLRYRTAGLTPKDMTYLFIFIAIGLLCGIQLEPYKLGVLQGVVVLLTFIFDGNFLIRQEQYRNIQYEKIELIKPENREALLADLKQRTGLNIHRVTINKINFLKDCAVVRVYYYDKKK